MKHTDCCTLVSMGYELLKKSAVFFFFYGHVWCTAHLAKLTFNHSNGRTHSWRFATFYTCIIFFFENVSGEYDTERAMPIALYIVRGKVTIMLSNGLVCLKTPRHHVLPELPGHNLLQTSFNCCTLLLLSIFLVFFVRNESFVATTSFKNGFSFQWFLHMLCLLYPVPWHKALHRLSTRFTALGCTTVVY